MQLHKILYKSADTTVDGTTTTAEFPVPALIAGGGEIVFGNITGLTGTLAGSSDGGTTYYNIPCALISGSSVAAGGTITAVDGLRIAFSLKGFTNIKFTRTAGSGPMYFMVIEDQFAEIVSLLRSIAVTGATVDTELPAAAALADNTVNPTVPGVGAFGMVYDGSTWDRQPGTSADGTLVNLGTNNDVTVTTLPDSIDGPGAPSIDSYGQVAINLAAAADQVLVSSAANKQIWVYGYHIMVNVAGTVSFQDEDNVALSGIMQFGVTGGATVSPSGNFSMPIWKLGTDKDLEVDVVTSELDGWLAYAIVSV